MSVEAITWALSQELDRSSTKFVLVALANLCNAEMMAWPSAKYLCKATCQDRKTVLDNLRRLKDAGFISDTGNRKGETGRISVYRLNSSENGMVPKTEPSRKRNSSENGMVPKTEPSRKRNSSENGMVPKTDGNSPENGIRNGPENGTQILKKNLKEPSGKRARENRLTSLPENFAISSRVKAWAEAKGHQNLDAYLEFFSGRMRASGKKYVDWDQAFINCIREDWPKLRGNSPGASDWAKGAI